MKIKQIVWDWNGTILNDGEASAAAVDDVLKARGLGRVSLEVYREKIVFPVRTIYNEAGLDFGKESFQRICDEYLNSYLSRSNTFTLHKDAEFVLMSFNERGLTQHIVSASDGKVLANQVEFYGIKSYFTNILGQNNNRADSKVNLAMQLLGKVECKAGEMLFIGDTIHDYEVAIEAGMNCALVSNGHCNEERLRKTGAPVYSNLTSLFEAY